MAHPPSEACGAPRSIAVIMARCFLGVLAALAVTTAAVNLAVIGDVRRGYAAAYVDRPGEDPGAPFQAVILTVAVALVVTVGLVLVGTGKLGEFSSGRITTVVVSAVVGACSSGLGLPDPTLAFGDDNDYDGSGPPSSATIARHIQRYLPDWYRPLTTTIAVLLVVFAAGAVTALLMQGGHIRRRGRC